jgi:hypothetical protein
MHSTTTIAMAVSAFDWWHNPGTGHKQRNLAWLTQDSVRWWWVPIAQWGSTLFACCNNKIFYAKA